ncbi:hypothetical protein JXR74_07135 [Candidatus Mcinerneyibacteriota bacterium]|nr:hypothetical protein [Candidatus Mcinerneyibacteriota bacterium]
MRKADTIGQFDKNEVKGECREKMVVSLEKPGFLTNIFCYRDFIIAQNRTTDSIISFSMEGKIISEYDKPGTGPGEMSEYSNLWVIKEGTAYITDSKNNKVLLLTVDPVTGELAFEDEFYIDSGQIVSLDVLETGRLLATTAMSDYKISEYNLKGEFVSGYGTVDKTKLTPTKVMESAYRVTVAPRGLLNSGIFNGELEFYSFENDRPELITKTKAAYFVKKGGMPPRPSVMMTTCYKDGYLILTALPEGETKSLLESYTWEGEFDGFIIVEDQKELDVVLVYPFGEDGSVAYQKYVWDEEKEKFSLNSHELIISHIE